MGSIHTLNRGYRRLHLNEYSGNSPYTPASYGSLMMWLYPQNGLSSLVSGSSVSQWNSYPGTEITLVTQSSAASQPMVTYDYFGGMPSLLFDGSNDYLSTTSPITMTGNWTAIFFCHAARTIPTGQLWTTAAGTGNYQFRISTNLFAYSNGQSFTSDNFDAPQFAVPKLFTATYSGGTLAFYDGLTAKNSGAWGQWKWQYLASQWSAEGTWFKGAMAEIVVYSTTLSYADITKLYHNYFSKKYPNTL